MPGASLKFLSSKNYEYLLIIRMCLHMIFARQLTRAKVGLWKDIGRGEIINNLGLYIFRMTVLADHKRDPCEEPSRSLAA